MNSSNVDFVAEPKALALNIIHSYSVGASVTIGCLNVILFRKRLERSPIHWAFFVTSTFSLVILLYLSISQILYLFRGVMPGVCKHWIDSQGSPILDQIQCGDIVPTQRKSEESDWAQISHSFWWFQVALILLSDGAIIYRATALCKLRFMRVATCVIWALCLVTGLLTLGLTRCRTIYVSHYIPLLWLSYTFIWLSFACNVLATTTFGVGLWQHRWYLKAELGIRSSRLTLPQRSLLAMLDSGVIYCISQGLYIAFDSVNIRNDSRDQGNAYFSQSTFTCLSGLYPAIVCVAANAQYLLPDEPELRMIDFDSGNSSQRPTIVC